MRKTLLLTLGFICLALGVIGAFLPVMPTTPFVLLAAFLFTKSSPGMYERIKRIPWLGKFIVQYTEAEVISTAARLEAIAILWVGLAISSVVANTAWVTGMLLAIGVAVTIHLLMIRRTPRQRHSIEPTEES
jgi:uncharacterized membrane protein YbaN (DUF454 family)